MYNCNLGSKKKSSYVMCIERPENLSARFVLFVEQHIPLCVRMITVLTHIINIKGVGGVVGV